MLYKIGQGFDAHQLIISSEPFLLGGVSIDCNFTVKGHSDGDALIHSIVDAILGALNESDIGHHFPSSNPKYKNFSSSEFLLFTKDLLNKKKYSICNIDATIILQKPNISNYRDQIKNNISKLLEIPVDQVSIKATTTDRLGFIGRGEGIAVLSNILIVEKKA